MRRDVGLVLFVGFVATVFAANWAIQQYGIVSVGFGYMAPAGVFFAGLAFTLRDLLHELSGRRVVVLAILLGAIASYFLEDTERIAIASGVAFLISEGADMAIYTPLRERNWLGAVLASNTVGLVIDSALFLWLAFGSLAFIEGQILAKGYMTLAAIAVLGVGRWSFTWALTRRVGSEG